MLTLAALCVLHPCAGDLSLGLGSNVTAVALSFEGLNLTGKDESPTAAVAESVQAAAAVHQAELQDSLGGVAAAGARIRALRRSRTGAVPSTLLGAQEIALQAVISVLGASNSCQHSPFCTWFAFIC